MSQTAVASAPDRLEQALSRIATDPGLHAFVRTCETSARREARFAHEALRDGRPLPLGGEPVAVKDIVDVAGLPTEAGSATRAGVAPAGEDATVVRRLRAAGGVIAGKTHTVEYAFGGWGTNPVTGTPVNPHDRTVHRVPGGSSSGSAVAVGGGLVRLALGTDTGGSVRLPAAFCGCVGYKTSTGLISRSGVVPLAMMFDTVGPMTRTVREAAVMAQVMAGSDPGDPLTREAPTLDLVSALDAGVAGLTIGHVAVPDVPLDPAVEAAMTAGLAALQAAGARVRDIRLPERFMTYTTTCGVMIGAEAALRYGHFLSGAGPTLGAPVAMRIGAAAKASAVDYLVALERRAAMTAAAHRVIEGCDLLVLPTSPVPAIPVSDVDESALPGLLTRFVNLMDWCGVSVPGPVASGALPVGVQVVARRFGDPLALRAAQVLESAFGT